MAKASARRVRSFEDCAALLARLVDPSATDPALTSDYCMRCTSRVGGVPHLRLFLRRDKLLTILFAADPAAAAGQRGLPKVLRENGIDELRPRLG